MELYTTLLTPYQSNIIRIMQITGYLLTGPQLLMLYALEQVAEIVWMSRYIM